LKAFTKQTRLPSEIIAFASDIDICKIDIETINDYVPIIDLYAESNLSDYGHAKRAKGLSMATGDFIGFFNADDSYEPEYIETMMREAESGADVAFCAWNEEHKPLFKYNSSTGGNFIVRTEIGRQAGYTDREYAADGLFIDRIAKLTDKIAFVDRILYYHNQII